MGPEMHSQIVLVVSGHAGEGIGELERHPFEMVRPGWSRSNREATVKCGEKIRQQGNDDGDVLASGPDSFQLDSDLKPPRVPNICQVTANHGDTILFLS
jgi:hypothetical protein